MVVTGRSDTFGIIYTFLVVIRVNSQYITFFMMMIFDQKHCIDANESG